MLRITTGHAPVPLHFCREKFAGAISEGGTPVPIPNTEVKPFSADGSQE
jgi:hypothetical protein